MTKPMVVISSVVDGGSGHCTLVQVHTVDGLQVI